MKNFCRSSIVLLLLETVYLSGVSFAKFIPHLNKSMVVEEKDSDHVLLKPLIRPVTVRHLLSHTSGLMGQSEFQQVTGADRFDEVDEATAIFKCAQNPPSGDDAKFVGFEGLPSDFYLKVAGQADDDEVIFQGCLFETVSPEVNQVPIPAWVFERFGVAVEERNFSYSQMLSPNGKFVNHWGRSSVPDITRVKTQLWFLYLAGSLFIGNQSVTTPTIR